MLYIFPVSLQLAADAADLADTIARKDSDLAKQLRRAAASVSLNLAEGYRSQVRNARARYYNALGSANEVRACLEVAAAMRLIQPVGDEVTSRLRHVIGSLVKLTRR